MEKCCMNCIRAYTGSNREPCRVYLYPDNGWDNSKDYCSKWEKKEKSEVEKLAIEITNQTQEGKFPNILASWILKKYVSKEKLIEFILEYKYSTTNDIDTRRLAEFIEEQTK